MKNKDRLDLIILASTAFLLFLIIFSSTALAVNNGNALASQGNYEEAIKAFDKAIEINSQDLEAWNNKGFCLVHLGDYEEAIKAFDKAIEIDSQSSEVWNNKGLCLTNLGDYEKAMKAYDKAIEIDSQSLEAWYNKGLALKSLDNYEEAIKAFDKAIEVNSHDSDAWYNKGYSLECLGNYEEAIKAFDKVIEIDPQDSYAWYNKGTCLAHLSNNKAAVKALDKAIEIDPQNSEALTLKESILSDSDGLMMSLNSLFSNNNVFVEEDDLLEYAQTYLKTYEDCIINSNLTQEERRHFSFIQGYPYSVSATISNIHGASIMFIPRSTDENKVTRVSYPIEKSIPKMSKQEINNIRICLIIDDNWSDFSIRDLDLHGGFIYVKSANDASLYQFTNNTSILLANDIRFNGLTYINSNKLFRENNIIINGTLVLNDSKVIMKSNLKKDWTKENAEEDAIATIYKELIDKIFDYSKLTGIGYREIEPLVTEYKEKENSGYYKTNKYAEWSDRQKIFDKAKQYGIPYESVLVELLNNKQEETLPEIAFRYVGDILTVKELAVLFIGIIGWIKRKDIRQKLKKVLRVFFRD
ncbi:MAG: tetratricopeptide repeat protein [Methanosarcina sp.]|jgi:tetratricopeptide (TPR) repeat protein